MASLAHGCSRLAVRICAGVERRWSSLVWFEANEVQLRLEEGVGRRYSAVQDGAVRSGSSQWSSVLPSNKQMQLTIGSVARSTAVPSGTLIWRFERWPGALPLATDL
jgi:hypothetical protein